MDRVSHPVRRALVTGGAGFIGRRLVERLLADGWTVAVLDLAEHPELGVPCYVIDLADRNALTRVIEQVQPDVVFHLAASRARSADIEAFRPTIEANLLGTLSLVEALAATEPGARLVAVGTAEEYGQVSTPYREDEREQPVSAYSFSKLAMTKLLETLTRLGAVRATVIRPSVCYGPGQAPDMFVSALVEALVAGREFPMTLGEQTRDFVYVDDLVDALVRAGVAEEAVGQVINVGSGNATRIRDLAATIERIASANGLVRLGAIPYRSGEQMSYVVDPGLARELLGWDATTDLETGLRKTIDAARAGFQ